MKYFLQSNDFATSGKKTRNIDFTKTAVTSSKLKIFTQFLLNHASLALVFITMKHHKNVSCQNSRFSWRLAYIYNIVNSRFCLFIKSRSGHSLNSFEARLMKLGMWIQINKQIIHVNFCFIQTTIVVAMVTKT